MPTPLPRSKVKKEQTWNAESVFATPHDFDIEVEDILDTLPEVRQYQGHLGDSIDTFIKAMNAMDMLEQRATKVRVYASLSSEIISTVRVVIFLGSIPQTCLRSSSRGTARPDWATR